MYGFEYVSSHPVLSDTLLMCVCVFYLSLYYTYVNVLLFMMNTFFVKFTRESGEMIHLDVLVHLLQPELLWWHQKYTPIHGTSPREGGGLTM